MIQIRMFGLLLAVFAIAGCDKPLRDGTGGAPSASAYLDSISDANSGSAGGVLYRARLSAADSAVRKFIAGEKGWAQADTLNCLDTLYREMLRDYRDYQPYHTELDIDEDGDQDVAIAVVRDGTYRIWLFKNEGDTVYAQPEMLDEMKELGKWGMVGKTGELVVGKFYGDIAYTYTCDTATGEVIRKAGPAAPKAKKTEQK